MARNDVTTPGDNLEKPRSSGRNVIKDAWRRARYPWEAAQAAFNERGNALYRPESSQKSFDKIYNIKSAAEFFATLERDEKRILNLVLKDLIREKQIKDLKGNDDIKVDKPIAHRMWQDILERSCDSRRKAIDSKLGRLISEPPAEVQPPETASHQFGEAGPSQIHGVIPTGGHDNQKQEYTVEKFNMPIFSHLTLNDLEELVREVRRSNNGNSENQDYQPVTKDDIESAAKGLKKHIEDLWKNRCLEHGILAKELLDGITKETKKDLNNVKSVYESLESEGPYNKLLRKLADRQDGNALLESPGWAGFARQFERTYKPETVFAKFLSKLPESTVRSPQRTALTLAALSPFGVGAAGVAVGVGIGAAGVGIGAAGVAAGVGIPLAGVYYGGKGILSLSVRANKALRIWNEARKEKLEIIKGQRYEMRNMLQKKKNELYEKSKSIREMEKSILEIRNNLPDKLMKQMEIEIKGLERKRKKAEKITDPKEKGKIENEIQNLEKISKDIETIKGLEEKIQSYKQDPSLVNLKREIGEIENEIRGLRLLDWSQGVVGIRTKKNDSGISTLCPEKGYEEKTAGDGEQRRFEPGETSRLVQPDSPRSESEASLPEALGHGRAGTGERLDPIREEGLRRPNSRREQELGHSDNKQGNGPEATLADLHQSSRPKTSVPEIEEVVENSDKPPLKMQAENGEHVLPGSSRKKGEKTRGDRSTILKRRFSNITKAFSVGKLRKSRNVSKDAPSTGKGGMEGWIPDLFRSRAKSKLEAQDQSKKKYSN